MKKVDQVAKVATLQANILSIDSSDSLFQGQKQEI
jgi:hypothetical protein